MVKFETRRDSTRPSFKIRDRDLTTVFQIRARDAAIQNPNTRSRDLEIRARDLITFTALCASH